jgi:copper(I)-binding protein
LKNHMARARTAGKQSHANRNRLARWLAVVLLAGLPLLAGGHGYRLGSITIGHPWAMPTDAVATTGTGYLVLRNNGARDDKLLSAASEIADRVEPRLSIKKNGALESLSTVSIAIPAGREIRLEPGGPHLLFIGLRKPLQDGQRFPVVLQFEHAGNITVDMFVQQNAKSSIY